jgi:hypothetical protein
MIFQVRKNMNSARRRFLKYLAASPLLAGSDLLAQEQRLPDPSVWAPRPLDKLIELAIWRPASTTR